MFIQQNGTTSSGDGQSDETLRSWPAWVDRQLQAIRAEGVWRANRTFDALGPSGALEGTSVTSFASNDYLGLSTHPEVASAARDALERWGSGATASRLIVGTRPVHEELEAALAGWKGTDRALVFPSGYATNVGVLSTLGSPGSTIFSDALNHASIIDGCRLGRARVEVYRHADLEHLETLLRACTGRRLVATDTVFSMDGDVADVAGLVQLCTNYDAMLVLDEAHAVLGPEISSTQGVSLVRVGTLSKTLGAQGGWVAAEAPVIDLLVNRARSYIFTTGLSPVDAAAAGAALRVLRSPAGRDLVERLRSIVERVRPGHESPIIPIILGSEERAVRAAAALLGDGFLVPAIRPPTVPIGTSRLRLALSALHTDVMVDGLLSALDGLGLASLMAPQTPDPST